MLVIRLFRVGKKNQPSFKIVVTDKRKSSTRGRFVEEVGFYNPLTKEKVLKTERIKYWLSVGAKPSPTVHNLLVTERMKVSEGGDEAIASSTFKKIIEGKKIDVHKKAKAKEEKPAEAPIVEGKPTEEKKEEKPTEAKPAVEEKPAGEKAVEKKPKEEEKPAEEKPKEEKKKEEPPKTE